VGKNIEVSNLNAISVEPIVFECDPTSLGTTLTATQKDMHVPNTSSDALLSDSMAEISEQPTNIRSWKRIMRQVNPSVAVSIVESGKKRKQSTCMASLPDFSCKRMQVKGTQYSSKLMEEPAEQPRQES